MALERVPRAAPWQDCVMGTHQANLALLFSVLPAQMFLLLSLHFFFVRAGESFLQRELTLTG